MSKLSCQGNPPERGYHVTLHGSRAEFVYQLAESMGKTPYETLCYILDEYVDDQLWFAKMSSMLKEFANESK